MSILTESQATLPTSQPHSDREKVDVWEREQLKRLGFDKIATDLLVVGRVSWHEVDRLLERGCPPGLVHSILL